MAKKWLSNIQYVAIFAFVVFGFVISFLMFQGIKVHEENQFRQSFIEASNERVVAIKNAMHFYENSLMSIAALFNSTYPISRDEFDSFSSAIIKMNPGIQALEWAPRLTFKDLSSYEAEAKKWRANFKFIEFDANNKPVPVDKRDVYYPVYYVVPSIGNERVIGFDLASNPMRKESLFKAEVTGQLVSTSRLKLIQEKREEYGILIFVPIFKNGVVPKAESERKKDLLGFVVGVFRVGDIVATALSHMAAKNIGVVINNISSAKDEQFLYYYPEITEQNVPKSSELSFTQTINVGDNIWSIECINMPDSPILVNQWVAWSAIFAGLMFTFLIAGYLLSLVSRNEKIALLVKIRSQELESEKENVLTLNKELKSRAELFRKFVPQQFLEILGFGDAEFIKLGEAAIHQLTIAFSDIRNFTTLAEKLPPNKLLYLINFYLDHIGSIIGKHRGFIDKFMGDGVLMIFQNADDAVRCAIELQQFVESREISMSERAGDTVKLNIGIGINTGPVITGTVGTAERMQTTVIGDTVNAAQRIEALNREYGTKVLVSSETRNMMDIKSNLTIRSVGTVKLKGKMASTNVYEIVEALSIKAQVQVTATLGLYEKGVEYFQQEDFEKAKACFMDCLDKNPDDKMVKYFLAEIERARSSR